MHYNDLGARLDMLNNSQIKSPKQPKEKIEIKVSPNQERIITTIDVGSLNNTLWWNGCSKSMVSWNGKGGYYICFGAILELHVQELI